MSSLPIQKKCVFVGSCYKEKTALLYTFTHGHYPEDYVPTVMDNNQFNTKFEDKAFSLGLWDTAGQEEWDRLRPLSYPQTDVFVVCFSIVDYVSFTDVRDKWVPELNHHCPSIPIILCAVQIELRNDETRRIEVTKEMAEEMCKETKCTTYLECSAKNSIGINELMDTVKELALFPERFSDKKSEKKKSSNKSGIFGRLKNVFQPKPTGGSNNSSPSLMESKQSMENSTTIIRLPMLSLPTMPDVRSSSSPIVEEKKPEKSHAVSRNYNEVSFEEWTTEEVSQWLQTKGCNQSVIDTLKNNDFGGTALLYCEKQDLTSLGISLGNSITILKWIENFKKNSQSDLSSNRLDKQSGGGSSAGNSSSSSDFPSSFQVDLKLSDMEISNVEKVQENEFEKRYIILEKLGEGGFGKCYKVKTRKTNQIRAVKVVSPSQDFTVNQALSEALKQAQLYREDNHIVHVYDVFIAVENYGQIVCIEMDCMEGNLRSIFKGRKISESMIWSIMRQIGAALKFLSESGKIVHRDIKPDNILVKRVDFETNEIEVYLSDFGLAKSTLNSIQTSHLSGTFFYLAPEILEFGNALNSETSRSPYSIASDIFALGVSIYQIMCHDTTSNIATLCKYGTDLIKQNIPSEEFSESLVDLVLKMLNKDPKERPLIDNIVN